MILYRYSPADLAQAIGVSPQTVRRLCRNGDVPATYREGCWCLTPEIYAREVRKYQRTRRPRQ